MIKLLVAISAVAVLGMTGGCADQTRAPALSAGSVSCQEVGTTGCKPDPSFGRQGMVGCQEVGTTGCKPDASFGREGMVGCKEVGTTGCKPDPALGVQRPQTPGMPAGT